MSAGFVTILNYILNYYPGVELELRDTRGFTALIKACMQGRQDCVSALLMHGETHNATPDTVTQTCRINTTPDTVTQTSRINTTPDTVTQTSRVNTTPDTVTQTSRVNTTPDTVTQTSRIRKLCIETYILWFAALFRVLQTFRM